MQTEATGRCPFPSADGVGRRAVKRSAFGSLRIGTAVPTTLAYAPADLQHPRICATANGVASNCSPPARCRQSPMPRAGVPFPHSSYRGKRSASTRNWGERICVQQWTGHQWTLAYRNPLLLKAKRSHGPSVHSMDLTIAALADRIGLVHPRHADHGYGHDRRRVFMMGPTGRQVSPAAGSSCT